MGKYLELFLGEIGDLTEKTKLENKPYVAYSTKLGKVTYTVVPTSTPDEPVIEGPADNEIWYTSSDEQVVTPSTAVGFGVSIVSNEYNDGQGVITFDGPVVMIGNGAFEDRALTSITIPNSVTSIGWYAFSCCALPSITIPSSVTSIGEEAFAACKSLNSIKFQGTIEEWNAVTKGVDWNRLAPATYVQCSDGRVEL